MGATLSAAPQGGRNPYPANSEMNEPTTKPTIRYRRPATFAHDKGPTRLMTTPGSFRNAPRPRPEGSTHWLL